jgi:signal transduction histidine kinase
MSQPKIIILIGFTAILAMVFIGSIIGITTLSKSNERLNQFVTVHHHKVELISRAQAAMRSRTFSLLHMLTISNDTLLQDEILKISKYAGLFNKDRKAYLSLVNTATEKSLIDEHDAITSQCAPIYRQVIDLILFDKHGEAEKLISNKLIPLQNQLTEIMSNIIAFNMQHGLDAIAENKENYNNLLVRFWLALAAVLLLSLNIIFFIFRLISKNDAEQQLSQQKIEDALDVANNANTAKSSLLSNMSHELRTPLHAIMGFTDIILCRKDLDPKLKKYNQRIQQASKHLLTLVDDALDLSKIENGKIDIAIEAINLQTALKECQLLIEPVANDAQLNLLFNINTAYVVQADATRLKQAILNLLSNAVKYNRQPGSITVSCECRDNNRIRINISDTGIGLSEHQKKQLFQPFERLDTQNQNIQGTGIGLTISKHLIELMGGTIGVESSEGFGSTFWLELSRVKS